MTLELIEVRDDERGETCWFVDTVSGITIVATEWFATERAAREWMAMGGGL